MNKITIEIEGLMNELEDQELLGAGTMKEFLQYRLKGGDWPEGMSYFELGSEDDNNAWKHARVVEMTMPLTRQEDTHRDAVPFDELMFNRGKQLGRYPGAGPWHEIVNEINFALHPIDHRSGTDPKSAWTGRLLEDREVA